MCILETASLYAICSTNQRELLDYRTKRVTWNDNNTTTLSPRHVLSLYHVHFLLNCRKPNFARTSVRRRLSPMLRKRFVSALAGARRRRRCNNNTREWSLWNFKRRANAGRNSFLQRKSIVTRKCLHRSCSWIPICVYTCTFLFALIC